MYEEPRPKGWKHVDDGGPLVLTGWTNGVMVTVTGPDRWCTYRWLKDNGFRCLAPKRDHLWVKVMKIAPRRRTLLILREHDVLYPYDQRWADQPTLDNVPELQYI